MTEFTSALEDLVGRLAEERLFVNYQRPYDHSKPFGPDNVGPYAWQMDVHNSGKAYIERLLMAANRSGKTMSAAAETACHAIGVYPDWWDGRRFEKPTVIWCGSESWTASRDIIQDALLGPVGEEGTGWIPKEEIVDWKKRQAGVSDVIDTIRVKHKFGGISSIVLKTYEQGRKEWQGRACDFIWLDEEPSMEIYTEALTRVLDKKGCLLMTFTPLKGPSDVVRHFLDPEEGSSTYYKNVGWDDAPHLDKEAKAAILAAYPHWEKDTRSKGTPLLGTGAVFPIRDEEIMVDPFELPAWWPRINGVDFGMDHPGAGVWCALDRDTGTFYVYDCYKKRGETAIYHSAALKKYGEWIPTSWPHDGRQRDKGAGDGVALKNQFRNFGVYMLPKHAHYPDERSNSLSAALKEMHEYMRTDRFKVFSTLSEWFEEKRLYHIKDDKVVAKYDDILSASRYAFMMRRYAKTKPVGTMKSNRPMRPIVGGQSWRS